MSADGQPTHPHDPVTGECILMPTEAYLNDEAIYPYWAGAVKMSSFYEVYEKRDDVGNVMPSDFGSIPFIALEFRHGQGQQITLVLGMEEALRMCRNLIDAANG